MLTVSINGKKVRVPSCREELSTGMYQEICQKIKEFEDNPNEDDFIDDLVLFSIVSGIDVTKVKRTKDYKIENTVWAVTDFIRTSDFTFSDVPLPKVIEIKGKKIAIPKRLGGLTLEQAIHVRQRLDKIKTVNECISYAVAIYLQPIYQECEFNKSKALEFEKEVLELPIVLTYPIGFFLLRKYADYGTGLMKIYNHTRLMLMKNKSRWLAWLNHTGLKGSEI